MLLRNLRKLKRSSSEERTELAKAGFVHVTGLTARRVFGSGSPLNYEYIIGENLNPDHYGRFDYNNGMFVIVTTGGEIWLAAITDKNRKTLFRVASKLCPEGKGAGVPCSNWEEIDTHAILSRVADPEWDLRGPYAEEELDDESRIDSILDGLML